MLCAGVTTYAALRRSQAKSGQWVVISGAGGGLGNFSYSTYAGHPFADQAVVKATLRCRLVLVHAEKEGEAPY